ncbi:MAG: hypothetical protein J3R72DRAFT_446420 [Linnemannia gamsii]|nr:MAG: hypothetical protein J3R72DRAFT_446420 [Linnemannia gamsii]
MAHYSVHANHLPPYTTTSYTPITSSSAIPPLLPACVPANASVRSVSQPPVSTSGSSNPHSLRHIRSSTATPFMSSSPSPIPTPAIPAAPVPTSAPIVSKERPVWRKPGMDALVAYMSNVDMMHRRLNPGKTAGNKAADIDQEMANYVNKVCNFSPTDQNYWTAKKANKSYGYARTLYDEANTLRTSTGNGNTERSTLRAEMLALYPKFDDLHRIYSSQLTRNHPPSRDAAPEARAHYNLEIADIVVESGSDTDKCFYPSRIVFFVLCFCIYFSHLSSSIMVR